MSKANIRSERSDTVEEEEAGHRETFRCPSCDGSLSTDETHAEIVCDDCGLVVEADRIDHGPEWRAFRPGERDEKSRVGAPTTQLLHDKGLSSHIGWEDKDGYGASLDGRQRRKMARLRTWDERFRTRDHKERNLKQALGEIERMGSELDLSKTVRETASAIYRRALNDDLLPGRSIEGVASAAIYAAARQLNTPRSIEEVIGVSRVEEMEIKRTYRYIVRELDLAVEPANPRSYLGRFASELGIEPSTERLAEELLETAEGTIAVTGKSPKGLAAGAIYAAARLNGEGLTQDDVGEVADVSTVTIRNRYQELLEVYEESQ